MCCIGLNFADIRRHDPDLAVSHCGRAFLIHAFLYVLPAFPALAAIGISTDFLVLVSAFEAAHLDPHMLNQSIYYGTVYGLLWLLYRKAKLNLVGKASLLPTVDLGATGISR